MLNQRREVVVAVAEKLLAFELALDQALIAGAALAGEMPQARIRARISAVVGQDAMDLVSEAVSQLTLARNRTVAAHHAFAVVQAELGIREKMSGTLWKVAEATPGPMALVTSQAA